MGTRERFLCVLTPSRSAMPEDPTPDEAASTAAHHEHLKRARESGVLILAGRTSSPPFTGIVVFEAEDQSAAERFVRDDPAVRAGVLRARVQPFRVALGAGDQMRS